MKLDKKRELAARTLGVGKDRIVFAISRLDDIKNAITRQDILQLYKEGAIMIKEKKGKRKKKKRKTRRRIGSRKKIVKKRKQEYVARVRRLRNYLRELKKQGKVSLLQYWELRKKIKASIIKTKAQLKEAIEKFEK